MSTSIIHGCEQLSLPLGEKDISSKKILYKKRKCPIGVVQLVEALRLVERQLPILLGSNIDNTEKEYIVYLVTRVLKYGTGVGINVI